MTFSIIDAWIQHPTQRFFSHPMFATLKRWIRQTGEIPEIPLEWTIAAMDEAKIEKSLTCAWSAPYGDLISNDDVADFVRQSKGRLVGIASVNLFHPMNAVRELRRCVKQLGFKGLRILPWLWNLPPDDRRYYPLYAECIELNIPFCLQVGHTGPLCPSEPGRPIPYLDHVALEFPELKIVAGHIGFPWTLEMISLATKYENIFIDTSAYKTKRFPAELISFLKTNGREKVMFGSNYPMLTPAQCLQDLEALKLDEETQRLFLYENAKRVFQL